MPETAPERQSWSNQMEYLLSAIGFAVGLGNMWRFNHVCYKYGGGLFLMAYIILSLVIGVPLYLLESGIGQFSSTSVPKSFNFSPIFYGLGFGVASFSIIVAVSYNVCLSWILFYVFKSAQALVTGSELPWKRCGDMENCVESTQMVDSNGGVLTKNCTQSVTELFYKRTVLGMTNEPSCYASDVIGSENYASINILDVGTPHYPILICLVLCWVWIGFSILKGVKTSGKIMYVMTLLPYVCLIILLVKGLTLPGAIDGIWYFLNPVESEYNFLSYQVWAEAVAQLFFSCSIGMGGVITLSSFNDFRNNLVKDAVVIVFADSFTSILGGFVIFSYLGNMSYVLGVEIAFIAGPGLTFIVWPEAMTKMSDNNYVCAGFSVVFFVMLYFMGVSSMIGLTETVITFILDLFPALKKKRGYVVAGTVVTLFLVAFPMVCTNGSHFFNTWDAFAAAYTLIILALFEVIAISWIYGTKRFINDIRMMTGRILPSWVELSLEWIWKVVAPVVLVYLLINKIVTPGSTNEYQVYGKTFKLENTGYIGYTLLAIPLALIIGGFALKVKKYGLDAKTLLEPTEKWGPAKRDDRINHQHERDDEVTYVPPEEEKSTMLSEM